MSYCPDDFQTVEQVEAIIEPVLLMAAERFCVQIRLNLQHLPAHSQTFQKWAAVNNQLADIHMAGLDQYRPGVTPIGVFKDLEGAQ